MTKEIYEVNVEGKKFQATFNYDGYMGCLDFIHENGKPDKRYTIKYKKIKEDKK